MSSLLSSQVWKIDYLIKINILRKALVERLILSNRAKSSYSWEKQRIFSSPLNLFNLLLPLGLFFKRNDRNFIHSFVDGDEFLTLLEASP